MNFKRCATSAAFGACFLAATAAWAQHGSHQITTPEDLKWQDVAALPPGAKIAVIEGNMSEAGTITARVKLPANTGFLRIPIRSRSA